MKYTLIVTLTLLVSLPSDAGYTSHRDCKKFEQVVKQKLKRQQLEIEQIKKRLISIEPELVTKRTNQ